MSSSGSAYIPKDFRRIVRQAQDAGWTLVTTGGNHPRLVPPGGGKGVTISSSPRNIWRARKKMCSELRRAGLDV